jgi:hypothetical protein
MNVVDIQNIPCVIVRQENKAEEFLRVSLFIVLILLRGIVVKVNINKNETTTIRSMEW